LPSSTYPSQRPPWPGLEAIHAVGKGKGGGERKTQIIKTGFTYYQNTQG